MKRTVNGILMLVLCCMHVHSHAQAFDKKSIFLSLGLGMVSDQTAGSPSEKYPLLHKHFSYTPLRPQIQLKADFGVQRYLSVGIVATEDKQMQLYNPVTKKRYNEVNVRAGTTVDFHFYQLMADKMRNGGKLHADKWDIYAGFTFGTDLRITYAQGVKPVYQIKEYMGFHIGARYRINDHWGIFGEVGYANHQVNAAVGLVYYFGGPKKRKRPIRDF